VVVVIVQPTLIGGAEGGGAICGGTGDGGTHP
jgi:hypothetical protein